MGEAASPPRTAQPSLNHTPGHDHDPAKLGEVSVVMWEAMVRMDMARRLKAHRALSVGLCSLALVGWGACALRSDRQRARSAISAPSWPISEPARINS